MSTSDASQLANRAEMDPRRLVVVSYLLLGFVLSLFLAHVFDSLFIVLGINSKPLIEGIGFRAPDVVGVVVAAGFGIYAWINPRLNTLSLDVASELMRVTWPSMDETRVSTFAVVLASIVASLILFGIDTLSYKLMVDWLPQFWGKL